MPHSSRFIGTRLACDARLAGGGLFGADARALSLRSPKRSAALMTKEVLMRFVLVLVLLIAANTGSLCAEERVVLHPDAGDLAHGELFIAKPLAGGSWPVILFVHGHQSA